MDAIDAILDYVIAVDPAHLPQPVIESTKRFLIDTITLMIVGGRAPGCEAVGGQAVDWGGRPEATIVSRGIKVPAPYAALANGMAAHAFDYDDLHEGSDVHGYAVIVPAVLAIAERNGGIAGPSLVAAIAIGVDVANRMGLAINQYRGWHATATCGIFGAAIAAGYAARLDRATLHHAAGIAYSLAAGTYQPIADGALSKRLQAGFAARGGIEAVLLATRGITGAKNVLQGKFGFYPLYERDDYDPEPLLRDLGTRFEGIGTSMKPFPSCRFCHGAADAALQLCREFRFAPEDITSITVRVPSEVHALVGGSYRPGESPQVSAQFSIAYNVSAAIVRGKLGLREFAADVVLDPHIRKLADRVNTVDDGNSQRFGKQEVAVWFGDGKMLCKEIAVMKGHPDNPMSPREGLDKARECMKYASFPPDLADRISEWTQQLDHATDPVGDLMCLTREARCY